MRRDGREEVGALPNVVRVVPNDDKPKTVALLSTDFGLTTAVRFGDGDGSCGAAIEPGVAGRTAFTLRVQTGCDEAVFLLHHSDDARASAQRPVNERAGARLRASRRGLQGDRADRRPSRLVRPRLDAARRRWSSSSGRCGERRSTGTRRCFASVRSSRWTARARSSSWSPKSAVSRRTFTCRSSTRAIACSSAMRRPYTLEYYARSSTTFDGGFRTRRSVPTSSSVFLVRPTTTSTQLASYLDRRRSPTCTCFRIPIVPALRLQR